MAKYYENLFTAFLNHKPARSPRSGGGFSGRGGQVALTSERVKEPGMRRAATTLYSYTTAIAVNCDGCCHGNAILMNGAKYSVTTSRQQRELLRFAEVHHRPVIEFECRAGSGADFNATAKRLHELWLGLGPLERAVLLRAAELDGHVRAPLQKFDATVARESIKELAAKYDIEFNKQDMLDYRFETERVTDVFFGEGGGIYL